MYGKLGLRMNDKHSALSEYGKCNNQITDKYCISNETGQECIVTRNEKGNILGNQTERQIRQCAH